MGNFMSCVLICGAMEVVQVVNTNGRVEKLIRPIRAAELIWAHERYKAAIAAGLNPSSAFSNSSGSAPENSDVKKPKPNPNQGPVKASPRTGEDSSTGNKFVLLPLDPSKPSSNAPVAEVGCRAYNIQCLSAQEDVSVKHQAKKSRSTSSATSTRSNKSPGSNNGSSNNNNNNINNKKQEQCQQASPGVTNVNHPPFRVKKEGGVTTLVVSKRYLEQLLSEKELKTSSSDMAAADILRDHNYLPNVHSNSKHSSRRTKGCSSSGRVSIWRPALESISESHNNNVGSTSGHRLSHQQQQQLLQQHHHRHHHQNQRQQ